MLFRGVKVKKGAVVKNCVLMQDTVVEPGAELDCVVTDKNVRITAEKKLSGTKSFPRLRSEEPHRLNRLRISHRGGSLPGSPS